MLLNTEDLKRWTGFKSSAALKKWMVGRGIPFEVSINGEICTTLDAVTHSLESHDKRGAARFL